MKESLVQKDRMADQGLKTRRRISLGFLGLAGAAAATATSRALGMPKKKDDLGTSTQALTEEVLYADVRNTTTTPIPSPGTDVAIFVRGRSGIADGGEGWFVWDVNSTADDDDGTVLRPGSMTTGRWRRVHADVMNVRWFGAKADGTDCSTAFHAAFKAVPSTGGGVYVPAPTADEQLAYPDASYVLSTTFSYVDMPYMPAPGAGVDAFVYVAFADESRRIRFFGDGAASRIKWTGGLVNGLWLFTFRNCADVTVEKLAFEGTLSSWFAMEADDVDLEARFRCEDCSFWDPQTSAECPANFHGVAAICGTGTFLIGGVVEEVRIQRVHVRNGRIGVAGKGSSIRRVIISDNVILHSIVAAISIVTGGPTETHVTDVVIERNLIEDSADVGIYLGDDSAGADDPQDLDGDLPLARIVVADNVIHRAGGTAGIFVRARQHLDAFRCSGNIIDVSEATGYSNEGPTGFGIRIETDSKTQPTITMLEISDNQIIGGGPPLTEGAGVGAQTGIQLSVAVAGAGSICRNQLWQCANAIVVASSTGAGGDSAIEIYDNQIWTDQAQSNGISLIADYGGSDSLTLTARCYRNRIHTLLTGINIEGDTNSVLRVHIYENTLVCARGLDFEEMAGISYGRIVENTFQCVSAGGPVPIPGGVVVYRNAGFVTEPSGSSSIAAGSSCAVTVPFGATLPRLPEAYQVVIVPTGFGSGTPTDPGLVWVDTLSMTTSSMVVKCQNALGAAFSFDWSIRPRLH